jgi:hypothetical protein
MTQATPQLEDPFYASTPARWLRNVVRLVYGIRILIEDSLGSQPVAASRQERVIWIQPGLPFITFRRMISDAVMYIEHGEAAAPMFTIAEQWLPDEFDLTNPN